MQIVRFVHGGVIRFGKVASGMIEPLLGDLPDFLPDPAGMRVALHAVQLLAPVVPRKIVAVGPNYKAHLTGRPFPQRPFLWVKPTTALNDPLRAIVLPAALRSLAPINHESELAIVIGRQARNVTAGRAREHVFGYTCLNDVTAGNFADRAGFRSSQLFVDGKVCDSFAPIGPWIETELDPSDLRIRCRVNGQTRQDHRTSDMIFPCDELVATVSRYMTLEPGDVIGTGSPPGVAALEHGDVVEVEVEGIGILRNPVVDEAVR